jgi:hypothetical protein
MASASVPAPEPAREAQIGGGGTTGGTQTIGGDSQFPAGGRIFVILGGNTGAAISAATGALSLQVAIGIGLGLVFLVWLFDVVTGARPSS